MGFEGYFPRVDTARAMSGLAVQLIHVRAPVMALYGYHSATLPESSLQARSENAVENTGLVHVNPNFLANLVM